MNVVGLDISKDTVDVAFLTDNQTAHMKIDNNNFGFETLTNYINEKGLDEVIICMEATGIYYLALANYLSDNYNVYVVNPLTIKKYAESELSRTKTDKKDAFLIADYIKRHFDKIKPYRKQSDVQQELQALNVLHHQLKQQITRHKNQSYAAFNPHIQQIHNDIIDYLKKQLKTVAKRVDYLIKSHSFLSLSYCNLLTIPGIGCESAKVLLQHLNSKEFKSANSFVAFAGLNPQIRQSGTSVKSMAYLTKLGHRQLKRALFMPALVAYRLGVFKSFVERLLASGKKKMVVIVAIMRKLATIAFYVYKTQKPFDASRYSSTS